MCVTHSTTKQNHYISSTSYVQRMHTLYVGRCYGEKGKIKFNTLVTDTSASRECFVII